LAAWGLFAAMNLVRLPDIGSSLPYRFEIDKKVAS
jgi:hypothetical protein